MFHYYTYLALDLVNERAREAELLRRAAAARAGQPAHPGVVRRGLANSLALVSRGSAAAVRRLDERRADDLTEALVGAK
jgi:plasmid stabilization system protein ParE